MLFTLPQNLFVNDNSVLTVVKCTDDSVSMAHLQPLLDAPDRILGVSIYTGKQCQLSSIAFSVLSRTLVVIIPPYNLSLTRDDTRYHRVNKGRLLIQEKLLLNPKFQKYAIKMDQVAVACHLELSIRISHAVDMLSVTNESRYSLSALMNALGGETTLDRKNVKVVFSKSTKSRLDPTARVALRAWAACRVAALPRMADRFASLRRIDTRDFPIPHLDAVSTVSRHADRLEALKPMSLKNDVRDSFTVQNNALNVECSRFPTRIKHSGSQTIRIKMRGGETTNEMVGRVHQIDGRKAQINVNGPVRGDRIVSVMTFGKDNPTFAESTRLLVTLKILQCNTNVLSNPFFRAVWLPEEPLEWPESTGEEEIIPLHSPQEQLNPSQCYAVERVLSSDDDDRVVMIQGPPGTGKTTVIATSVISYHHAKSERGIWVAAQSNVAVKNIAEKFLNEGFGEFRILVSKDFHYDWHEHLYHEIQERLILSDSFGDAVEGAERRTLDCKVILCTLSMFSHPHISVFLPIIPVEMIILDEASQIECGNYLPIFHRFHTTLWKLVFVGDQNQLPPYGQDDIQELRSVFEFPHLRTRAAFLDTQYRMPHVIGDFISHNVYDGALFTNHPSRSSRACRFVDVTQGEEFKSGHSWVNEEEARVVVKLARLYQSRGMSYRIITPYDAQRSRIEDLLKAAALQWGDKVFNVDSFQGNEDEHIIISVVRTEKPGFLKSKRRTNVMLTRCKQSMIVCSNRVFLLGTASETLVGKFAASVSTGNWINGNDVLDQ